LMPGSSLIKLQITCMMWVWHVAQRHRHLGLVRRQERSEAARASSCSISQDQKGGRKLTDRQGGASLARAAQRRRVPTRTQSVCRQPATCLRYYAACQESPIVRHPSFTRLTNILTSASVTPSRAIIIMTIGSLRRSSSDGSRGTRLRPICDGWCMGAPELV
jgi:hypothetical protein